MKFVPMFGKLLSDLVFNIPMDAELAEILHTFRVNRPGLISDVQIHSFFKLPANFSLAKSSPLCSWASHWTRPAETPSYPQQHSQVLKNEKKEVFCLNKYIFTAANILYIISAPRVTICASNCTSEAAEGNI